MNSQQAAYFRAPETIHIFVCPECGRNDTVMPFTGKAHFVRGEKCYGQPVRVKYRKENTA